MSEAVNKSKRPTPGTSPARQSLAGRKVDSLMITFGLAPRDMDARCGWSDNTFSTHRSRGFIDLAAQSKIERALGHRLFCDPRTWTLREACFRRYSFDPALLSKPELQAWIKKLSLNHRVPPDATRDQLVTVILNHLAINPVKS